MLFLAKIFFLLSFSLGIFFIRFLKKKKYVCFSKMPCSGYDHGGGIPPLFHFGSTVPHSIPTSYILNQRSLMPIFTVLAKFEQGGLPVMQLSLLEKIVQVWVFSFSVLLMVKFLKLFCKFFCCCCCFSHFYVFF